MTTETTISGITSRSEVHDIGVEYVSRTLIENGISTRNGPGQGIDLVLDDGKTILVKALSNYNRISLMKGSLDDLKSDYLIIADNLEFKFNRNIYIMAIDKAKYITNDYPNKSGESSHCINKSDYNTFINNFSVIINGYNI